MATERRDIALGNRILRRLPAAEQRLVAAETEPVEYAAGDVLCRAGANLTHVYFPRRGVLSLFARIADGPHIGVGVVRSDGMFGLAVAAGRKSSDLLAVSQGSGQGDRLKTGVFHRLLQRCPGLQNSVFAYAHGLTAQMAQNVACVAFHPSRQRVARWMLDITEGSDDPGFAATQTAIAAALGLQRPAVSRAATDLQRSGVIRYLRGRITILDRPALRSVACRCSLRESPED